MLHIALAILSYLTISEPDLWWSKWIAVPTLTSPPDRSCTALIPANILCHCHTGVAFFQGIPGKVVQSSTSNEVVSIPVSLHTTGGAVTSEHVRNPLQSTTLVPRWDRLVWDWKRFFLFNQEMHTCASLTRGDVVTTRSGTTPITFHLPY